MKSFRGNRHAVAGAFIFLLLGAFTVFSTLLILLGARAYSGIVTRAEQSVRERNLVSYTLSKVRSLAFEGAVQVSAWGDTPMLVLSQQVDDDTYETRIYCHGGSLRELFFRVDGEDEGEDEEAGGFSLGDGEVLIAADYFVPQLEGDMLYFQVGTGDQVYNAGCRLRA